MKYRLLGSIGALVLLLIGGGLAAQEGFPQNFLQTKHYSALRWREIGPFRGGRVNAVTGVPGQPFVYYMGSTGGGVWKTEDAGLTWNNISDGYLQTGSIGAIALAPSDPNVVYVGTGEHAVRGVMSSHGDGVYRSDDGGQTWRHLGLSGSRHIAAIQVHPQNPEVVYVAVQGAVYGPTEERGVYRSTDGGRNWERVLFFDETTGASDLSLDPSNPRIIYAATWDHGRVPWSIRSGGPGSGLWKSLDGGETWKRLIQGLPVEMGKTAITVSPADPRRVYANVEAELGGIFRSDDGGETWKLINADRQTVARAWYYIELVPDPRDRETIYVLNAPLLRSIDGGRSFTGIPNPHSDQHALWINPANPQNMILGNDGGACITFNGGRTWTRQDNQPTAQIYRVITDHRFPYHLYGGQQDNTTLAIASRTTMAGIGAQDRYPVSGGESAFVALDPDQPEIIYGTGYQGNVSLYDAATKQVKDIMAYPIVGLAMMPADMKYRFNWNAPLVADPHDPRNVYHGANVVLRTRDRGYSWVPMSEDLTRNEKHKQGAGGGPYTNEGAGGETYNTISYIAVSPHKEGTIWAGTDDGLVHLTRDGIAWQDVTPPDVGEATVNCIEVSPHDPSAAYVVFMRYKFNDFTPLIYYTSNYGRSWSRITRGIPPEDFVRVVREDPIRRGLLYAGTETGFYVSTNRGEYWYRFQLNLPVTPVTDLRIEDNDLVASTSGRGFWILDNLSPLQQGADLNPNGKPFLFQPDPAVRLAQSTAPRPSDEGENPLPGMIIDFYLHPGSDSLPVELQIFHREGQLVRRYRNRAAGETDAAALLPTQPNVNRFSWDLHREPLTQPREVSVLENYRGGLVMPGEYLVRLLVNDNLLERRVRVLPDPRLKVEPEVYADQQQFQVEIEGMVRDLYQSVQQLREVRQQIATLNGQLRDMPRQERDMPRQERLIAQGDTVIAIITRWEEQLVQPAQQTPEDVINFPNRLNAELMDLHDRVGSHDPTLTYGAKERLDDLKKEWLLLSKERDRILDQEVVLYNRLYEDRQLPAVIVPRRGPRSSTEPPERVGTGYGGRGSRQ